MSDLDRLVRQADRVRAPDLWPEIEHRHPREPRPSLPRRVVVGAVALAVAGAGIGLAAAAFLDQWGQRRVAASPLEVHPRITAEVPVGQFPQEIAVGEGGVWVTVNQADPPEHWYVARIDPATNQVTDEIEVREVLDVAAGSGAVWATTYDRSFGWGIVQIDPGSRSVVRTIPLNCDPQCAPTQIAVADEAVWVTASTGYPERGLVIRIDPAAGQVVDRIEVPGDPRDLVAGQNGVWVFSLTHWTSCCVGGGTLYRIDPATNAVTANLLDGRIPPASGVSTPPVLAAGHGFVWTSAAPGDPIDLADKRIDVVRVDPASDQVTGRARLGTLFFPFASDSCCIWFRGGVEDAAPTIGRLDPISMRVVDELPLETTVLDGALDSSTQTIWLSTYRGRVLRIDLR
jgi:DNA-binding beta-propeller fold protein YncE